MGGEHRLPAASALQAIQRPLNVPLKTAGVDPIPASWWINFGTYIKEAGGASVLQPDQAIIDKLPML
ncbi:MAG: hypothetical protein RR903_15780, partial [Edwardsiella sp. (in: enterobacteria)]